MTAVSSRNIQTQLHFFGNKTDNEMEAERGERSPGIGCGLFLIDNQLECQQMDWMQFNNNFPATQDGSLLLLLF